MKRASLKSSAISLGVQATCIAAGAAMLGASAPASAFSINAGNPDIDMRWDNTLSYTGAMRTSGRDSGINANPALSADVASDYFANKYGFYTSRFDLFSEFDFKYKKDSGFRISGAAWYDPLFPGHPKVGPGGFQNSPFGPSTGSQGWPGSTKHFYSIGAEPLDAFAFTRFDLGNVPVNLKVGRTSQVWGESMFGQVGGINSVGYGQSPNDGRKATQNPNASLKETVLPIGQVDLNFNLTENSNLSLFKTLEWRADRVPASGTFYGFADGVAGAPNLFCASNFCLPYLDPVEGQPRDWGVQYKFRPGGMETTSLGVILRQFDEKAPWYGVWDPFGTPFGAARSVYGRNTQLLGLTFNTNAWDISWAGEVSYRRNAALTADYSALATPGAGGANTTIAPTDGPRGNTLHALFNMQAVYGKALFWDTFTVAGELAYNHLLKVTKNPQYFEGTGAGYAPVLCNLPAGAGGSGNRAVAGCANRSSMSLGLYLDPTIYQVFPSVDLEIPIFVSRDWGNSPLNGGGTDGATTISAGLKFTWNTAHGPQVFQLSYLGFRNKTSTQNAPGHNVLGAPYYDRDSVLFTYTTSF